MVGAIGCSNFSAAELEEAERASRREGWARFVTLQNQYSLLQRGIEVEVAPACERLEVSILPFFPLARGLLSGKYERGVAAPPGSRLGDAGAIGSEEQFDTIEAIEGYAEGRRIELLDVAIGGLAAQPAVASVIAGATRARAGGGQRRRDCTGSRPSTTSSTSTASPRPRAASPRPSAVPLLRDP